MLFLSELHRLHFCIMISALSLSFIKSLFTNCKAEDFMELWCFCRTDNNWHDIRTKVFPPRGKKSKEPECTSTSLIPPPARRKERSLSSLVVSKPRVPSKSSLTGKRSKLIASQESPFANEEHVPKPEDFPKILNSLETYNKVAQKASR